jgi:hypothetical protein
MQKNPSAIHYVESTCSLLKGESFAGAFDMSDTH